MFGFIVTTHFNNYDTIKKCLDLLFNNIPEDSYIVLYVNETTCDKVKKIKDEYTESSNSNKDNGDNCDNFEVFYIDNQEANNGLTGTWNHGINYLLKLKETTNFECKVITILGHDTFINKDIKYLLEPALEAENKKELKYFGPLYKNFKGKDDELWQDELHYKKYTQKFIIGSLFTFPVNSLIQNKLRNNHYFDEIKFPFGYNDIDWYNRFIKIRGKPVLITNCIIDHKYQRTWVEYDRNIKKYRENNQVKKIEITKEKETNKKTETNEKENNCDSEIENLFTFYSTKCEELDFNWISYLNKNPDLKHKGLITNPKQALDHYLTKGIYQNRKY